MVETRPRLCVQRVVAKKAGCGSPGGTGPKSWKRSRSVLIHGAPRVDQPEWTKLSSSRPFSRRMVYKTVYKSPVYRKQ